MLLTFRGVCIFFMIALPSPQLPGGGGRVVSPDLGPVARWPRDACAWDAGRTAGLVARAEIDGSTPARQPGRGFPSDPEFTAVGRAVRGAALSVCAWTGGRRRFLPPGEQ